MSDSEEIERIRERKRENLLGSVEETGGDEGGDAVSTPDSPVHVDGATGLEELVADGSLVLLEFYADWCGPCKMLEPVLEELAASTDATVAKVDVDENQELAASYQVRGVPTILLFEDGEVVERMTSARDRAALEGLIEQHVG